MTAPDAASNVVELASGGAVQFSVHEAVAAVALSRPNKLNAINKAVLRGLAAAMELVNNDDGVRAVVIRGEGRGFSAGGDLAEVADMVLDSPSLSAFLDNWHTTLNAVENCRVPVIGAVHGVALAGGFELLQVCDLVVVGDRTQLGDQHANYGLFPAGGSTQRLPRQIGRRQAMWLLVSGQAVTPSEALALGLVNRVVDEDQVLNVALEMAEVVVSRSASGTAAIKAAIRLGGDLDLISAIAAERQIALDHMASADVQTGLAAFRARTTPRFADIKSEGKR
ncbi:MAG TPA: enoyl-CoA hydratase/isomerase family protein [Candidatus Acidoferrum sp.]|jgi:enoyl-CoA hydratase/carnithine racemase|nr:enoyl-CoA hydratase/isomerase family protein [Candidatus Acidoferrum sp.]